MRGDREIFARLFVPPRAYAIMGAWKLRSHRRFVKEGARLNSVFPSRELYEALRGESRIDVIIPMRNARATLARTLASLAMQTIADDLDVTLVDDASTEEYGDILCRFEGLLKLRVLRIEPPNRYAGYARQLGLDSTRNDFITFVDADDTLSDAFALARLFLIALACETCHVVCGAFAGVVNEWSNTVFIAHRDDRVHAVAKLYRRSFLKENGIRFNTDADACYNEDFGFSVPIFLCFEENIFFSPDIAYHWHENPSSLTHRGGVQADIASAVGYIVNAGYAFDKCQALRREGKTALSAQALAMATPACFMRVYSFLGKAFARGDGSERALLPHVRRLAEGTWRQLQKETPPDAFQKAREALDALCCEEEAKSGLARVLPVRAFWELLEAE